MNSRNENRFNQDTKEYRSLEKFIQRRLNRIQKNNLTTEEVQNKIDSDKVKLKKRRKSRKSKR